MRKGLATSRAVKAVDGVSFDLSGGHTLGIAGESGSGKSTVARTLVRIVRPTGGTIAFDGAQVAGLKGQRLKRYRRRMQMVYQDPYDSLDPRMSVLEVIGEALTVRGLPRNQHSGEVERASSPCQPARRGRGALPRTTFGRPAPARARSPVPWR